MGDFFQAYQETLVKPGLPCFYSEVGDFNQAYQEIWLNEAYNAFKVKNLNQIYQKTRKISTRPTRKAW